VDWLALATLHELHQGDVDGAIDSIASLLALARFQGRALGAAPQYLRLRTVEGGLKMTWETLQAIGATESQLARLQSIWETDNFTDEILESLEQARAQRLSWLDQNRSLKGFWAVCKSQMSCCHDCGDCWHLDDLWFDARAICRVLSWRLAWFDQDKLQALKDWQACLDDARVAVPQGDRSRFHFDEWTLRRRRSRYDFWRLLQTYYLEPDGEMMVMQPMRAETERRMALVAIALKRYELAHGSWPDSLSELTPSLLAEVPRDLMNGRPLRYRRNADSTFTLYSVGQNCADDGGSVERDLDSSPYGGWFWRTCDAVWPMPATAEEVAAIQRQR